jgi:hypothetical protein
MTLPSDSAHLSDVDHNLFLEQYGGGVESQFAKSSFVRQYAVVRNVTKTDTIVNNRVGKTTLQKLVPGVRPDATATPFGKVTLTVDTVILARDNRSMLNEFQTHFEARAELAKDHGKELGKFFDEAFIIQTIKGAGQAAPSGLNGAIGAGKSVTLAALLDELDPDKLYTAIAKIITDMEEEDIDTEECVILVRPTQYDVLLNNDKLLDRNFSANGDFAGGMFSTIKGVRVISTARIPKVAIANHRLSNVANGMAYDVSATEAKAVAVIMHPKSLLAGETIPLQSDIWFSKEEKQWFIDSFMAFAVTVNRPDVCGRVLRA